MSAKRKKKIDPQVIWDQDEVLIALKERWFKLAKKEKINKTPQITDILDKLEAAISKRKEELDANT
jgi:hypothetical protein